MDIFGDHWDDHVERIERNWKEKVDPEDTVLIAGDISWAMTFEQALFDLKWLAGLPGKKILTKGNHDYWWKKIKWMRKNLPPSIYPLQNDSIVVKGRTICGAKGYTIPVFGTETYLEDKKYFERERARLKLSLDSAKNPARIIVMIHYPPFISHIDDPGFSDIIQQYQVETVVYGHLHSEDCKKAFIGEKRGVKFIFTSADGIDFCPVKVD